MWSFSVQIEYVGRIEGMETKAVLHESTSAKISGHRRYNHQLAFAGVIAQ